MLRTRRPLMQHMRRTWLYFSSDHSSETNEPKKIFDSVELPEEPTNCCMSGCANCVWIEYAATLAQIFNDGGEKAQKMVLERISDPSMKIFLTMELKNFLKNDDDKSGNGG